MIDKKLHQQLEEYTDKQKKCYGVSSDDLIADLYIYTHDKPEKIPSPNDERVFFFKAWLRNQANWICLNKTSKYYIKGNDSEGLEDVVNEDLEPKIKQSVVTHQEVKETVLNGKYNTIYRLFYEENNTQKEVAQIMNINISIINEAIKKINYLVSNYINKGEYQIKLDLW